MGKGKPRGLNAARKLRNHRREGKWADLTYKKRLLGTAFKSSPFGGSSHAKGIVLEKVGVEAKQPNSAIRKCVKVQLIKNGKKVTAFGAYYEYIFSCLVFLDGFWFCDSIFSLLSRWIREEKKGKERKRKRWIIDGKKEYTNAYNHGYLLTGSKKTDLFLFCFGILSIDLFVACFRHFLQHTNPLQSYSPQRWLLELRR